MSDTREPGRTRPEPPVRLQALKCSAGVTRRSVRPDVCSRQIDTPAMCAHADVRMAVRPSHIGRAPSRGCACASQFQCAEPDDGHRIRAYGRHEGIPSCAARWAWTLTRSSQLRRASQKRCPSAVNSSSGCGVASACKTSRSSNVTVSAAPRIGSTVPCGEPGLGRWYVLQVRRPQMTVLPGGETGCWHDRRHADLV